MILVRVARHLQMQNLSAFIVHGKVYSKHGRLFKLNNTPVETFYARIKDKDIQWLDKSCNS